MKTRPIDAAFLERILGLPPGTLKPGPIKAFTENTPLWNLIRKVAKKDRETGDEGD